MPKQVLVEVIAWLQPIAENAPTITGFYLLLRSVDGTGFHIIHLRAIYLNLYQLGGGVFVIDAITSIEISRGISARRGEMLLLYHPQITDTLQGKDGRSLAGKRFGHQVPTLLPSFQETGDELLMGHRPLVERMIIELDEVSLVYRFENEMQMFHSTGCVFQNDLILVLYGQFHHSLDVESRKEILVDGIALNVGKVFDVITFGMDVVFNVDGKDTGDIILIATESLGDNLTIV